MVGGFSTNFTQESCERFFITVPVFKVPDPFFFSGSHIEMLIAFTKVLAAVASHGVFVFRTYAICGRSRPILYFLVVFGGLISVAEIVSPVVVPRNALLGTTGNCISDLAKGSTSWIQYMCQVLFDVVILGFTMDRLFRGTQLKMVTRSEFTKIFWESQVMYFIAVTVMNIESTMLATLGMAITAIFSARVSE
ncbi:hypothetical protein H0H93_001499 [Arthromyces matolae]|nr:hypothetical protein H0H93_001499 [Arthromyces matolae]